MASHEQESTENTTSSTDQLTTAMDGSNFTDSNTENPTSTGLPRNVQVVDDNVAETANANEEEEDPSQINEEAVAEHERKIAMYEVQLANSASEEDRPTGMVALASSMADLYSARQNAPAYKEANLELLHKAAEKCRDAIEMVDEDYVNWAYVIASSANVFHTLYDATKEAKYLDETIDASTETVKCYVDKEFFARRSYRLACQLQERWIIQKCPEDCVDLVKAIDHAKSAVDNTYLFNHTGRWRLTLYSSLVAEHAVLKNNIESLEALIDLHTKLRDDQVEQDEPEGLYPDEKKTAWYTNLCCLETAYCWHWGLTKKSEDLDQLVECVNRILLNEDIHRGLKIREAARLFYRREVQDHDKRYEVPMLGLEIVEALYQDVWKTLPRTKNRDLDDLHTAVVDVQYAVEEIWDRTHLPTWGWKYDEFNTLNAHINVMKMSAENDPPDDEISVGMSMTVGESIVLKQMIVKPGVTKDPFDVSHTFILDIKPENYIWKRNDDGTVELGMTEEDEVIWNWYHNRYEKNVPVGEIKEAKVEEVKDEEEKKEEQKKDEEKE